MILVGIHHLRFAVECPEDFAKYLKKHFGFEEFAIRQNQKTGHNTIALKHQDATFLIQKRIKDISLELGTKETSGFLMDNICYPVDTVCDVCFQCNNLDEIVKKASSVNPDSVLCRRKIKDADGIVKYAVIQSVVGNVHHTLLDLSQYHGEFLPEFELRKSTNSNNNFVHCIDHIALCGPTGFLNNAISWYNYCFGFERLTINRHDSIEDGLFVQQEDMGMKLKAVQGMNLCANDCKGNRNLNNFSQAKLVFVESTSDPGKVDQITQFVNEHRGPGVQHVGLGTHDIVNAVKHFKQLGTDFMVPPIEYFEDEVKCKEIEQLEMSVDRLKEVGVMVESGSEERNNNSSEIEIAVPQLPEPWYIMQIFTKNVFKEKTFFMELIERHHTEGGFGAGNIKALWTSMQLHLEKLKALGMTAQQ